MAGKEAEKAESMPQNEAQGVESHSVAMLAVAPARLTRNLADRTLAMSMRVWWKPTDSIGPGEG